MSSNRFDRGSYPPNVLLVRHMAQRGTCFHSARYAVSKDSPIGQSCEWLSEGSYSGQDIPPICTLLDQAISPQDLGKVAHTAPPAPRHTTPARAVLSIE